MDKLPIVQEAEKTKLPSRFQPGDKTSIKTIGFLVENATVNKVHFTENKVFYDLEVEFSCVGDTDQEKFRTRIYNVDSAMLAVN
jgi:hypothetical protein